MSKEKIDEYFNKNYKQIIDYIKNCFFNNHIFNEEPEYFATELYLFILKKKEIIKDEVELKKFVSNFIYMHTKWSNSNYRESGQQQKRLKNIEFTPEFHDNEIDESLDELINDEIKLDDYQAICELYRQNETNLEKQIVWDIFFVEGKKTYKEFGEYCGFSITPAGKFIKQLKKDLKEFYDDYKKQYLNDEN